MAGAVGETRAALAAEAAGRTWAEVERSPAEAGLRQSEARFRALAETSPLAVAATSQDEGTFLYADRAFQAIVGHDGDACSAARRSSRRNTPLLREAASAITGCNKAFPALWKPKAFPRTHDIDVQPTTLIASGVPVGSGQRGDHLTQHQKSRGPRRRRRGLTAPAIAAGERASVDESEGQSGAAHVGCCTSER